MFPFDQGCSYQFVVYFAEALPQENIDREMLDDISGLVAESRDNRPNLRFGDPDVQAALQTSLAGGMVPTVTASWSAMSGVWRLVLTTTRLDLHYDAHGHAEIIGEDVATPRSILDWIGANLTLVGESIDTSVNRAALVVKGRVGQQVVPEPGKLLARSFLNESLSQHADSGNMLDGVVRVNVPTTVDLEGRNVRTNRIETTTVNWRVAGPEEVLWLEWQGDFNVSPAESDVRLSPASLERFLQAAADWQVERLQALDTLRNE